MCSKSDAASVGRLPPLRGLRGDVMVQGPASFRRRLQHMIANCLAFCARSEERLKALRLFLYLRLLLVGSGFVGTAVAAASRGIGGSLLYVTGAAC